MSSPSHSPPNADPLPKSGSGGLVAGTPRMPADRGIIAEMAARRFNEPMEPMTLGNMRTNGGRPQFRQPREVHRHPPGLVSGEPGRVACLEPVRRQGRVDW
jgi:hypothetical protein